MKSQYCEAPELSEFVRSQIERSEQHHQLARATIICLWCPGPVRRRDRLEVAKISRVSGRNAFMARVGGEKIGELILTEAVEHDLAVIEAWKPAWDELPMPAKIKLIDILLSELRLVEQASEEDGEVTRSHRLVARDLFSFGAVESRHVNRCDYDEVVRNTLVAQEERVESGRPRRARRAS